MAEEALRLEITNFFNSPTWKDLIHVAGVISPVAYQMLDFRPGYKLIVNLDLYGVSQSYAGRYQSLFGSLANLEALEME